MCDYNESFESDYSAALEKDWSDCSPSEQEIKFDDLYDSFAKIQDKLLSLEKRFNLLTEKRREETTEFVSGQVTALNILKNGEIEKLKATIAVRDAEIQNLKATIVQLNALPRPGKFGDKTDAFAEWRKRGDLNNGRN